MFYLKIHLFGIRKNKEKSLFLFSFHEIDTKIPGSSFRVFVLQRLGPGLFRDTRGTKYAGTVPGTVCGDTVASGGQPAGKEHRSPRPPTDHRLMSSAKEDDEKRQQKGKKKDRGRSVAWPQRGGDAAGRGRSGAEMQRVAAEAERG